MTLENIPPKSLGGKVRALTCKKCNSVAGHTLDNHLLKRLTEIDFHSFLPNSQSNTTFSHKGNKVNGRVNIDNKRTFIINLDTLGSNPKESEKFMSNVFPPRTIYGPIHKFLNPDFIEPEYKTESFEIKKEERSDEKRAEIALLRIAYLYAFSLFGNGFLINGYLFKVREQIQKPDEKILNPVYWIKYEFPENMIGLNIIKQPKELQSFLIIFNLETSSTKRQFAICLPGPTEPGIEVYENIQKLLCEEGESIDVDIEHIDEKDLLTQKGYEFAANYYWNKIARA